MGKKQVGPSLRGTDPRLPAIVERMKGGASLAAESKALGFKNNHSLRHALRELLGREGYDELIDGNANAGVKRWRAQRAANRDA